MGNSNLCCNYDPKREKHDKLPTKNYDPNFSYDQNLIEQQQIHDINPNPILDEDLNESSIIGIADFNSTSYINVNLQVLSRLKYFTDFIDIKLKMKGNFQGLKNLKIIFSNLFKGFPCNSDIKNFINEIGHLDEDSENKIKVGNDALNFHDFILDYINKLCYKEKVISKDNYSNEDSPLSQKEILKLKEDFRMSFENEIKEMFYLGYICSYNNSNCEVCKSFLPKYEISSFSHIDLSTYNKEQTMQKNIDHLIFETKLIEILCHKCNSRINVKEYNTILNYPKYLIVKMELINGLELEKISQIKLHKKMYALSNIIFTQDKEENIKEYTVSTKLNAVWYYCDNNNNVSILKDYSLNNTYVLYYSRIDATL